jgi:5-methylcytosine-specific restriction endonuclease McrA
LKLSVKQVNQFRTELLKLDPPDEVLQKFDQLLSVQQQFEFEDQLEDLLKDACRVANWTKPWETSDIELTFRARLIDPGHAEHHSDVGGENSPAIEQAFRRGLDHGFHRAMQELGIDAQSSHPMALESAQIGQWRRAELQARNMTSWGSYVEPDYPCIIRTTLRRSGLKLSVRWSILSRDNRRCVVCGSSAEQGATLEVDHIISVADGGTDQPENLRTLCFDCNRGKGASSG